MSKLSERAFRRATDPDVVEAINEIVTLWNAGRYQSRIFSSAPTYTGQEGEIVLVNQGGTKSLYAYIGGAWVSETLT